MNGSRRASRLVLYKPAVKIVSEVERILKIVQTRAGLAPESDRGKNQACSPQK